MRLAALIVVVAALVATSLTIVRGVFRADRFSWMMDGDEKLGLDLARTDILLVIGRDWTGVSAWSYTVEPACDLRALQADILFTRSRHRGLGGWRPKPPSSLLPRHELWLPGISYASVQDRVSLLRLSMWWPETLLALGTIYLVRRVSIANQRLTFARCAECGYDMRATPFRCPECGTLAVVRRSGRLFRLPWMN